MDDLTTYCENTWCPGCGNFGIFNAFKKAVRTLEENGTPRDNLVITAGIGCHGKIFDYLKLSGLYSLHGRSMATAQGMKVGNPDLKVVGFAGDGDSFGEGLAHMIFAAKRNADITMIIHDNGVYGLTTGQFTPLSEKGFKGPSTPRGSIEEPLNPLTMMLEAGATFVARCYSGKIKEMTEVIVQAVKHEGFSFVDILQPCVSFNDTYKKYNDAVEILDKPAKTLNEAFTIARRRDKLPVGIIYQRTDRPAYHKALYGDANPATKRQTRKDRIKNIEEILEKA